MNEELKAKLRASGFPFPKVYSLESVEKEGEPSLESLLEMCGEHLILQRSNLGGWGASKGINNFGRGATPREAVASLFCALHPSKEPSPTAPPVLHKETQ